MQVTRALEYANRAMVLLATYPEERPLLVAEIARSTAAPPNFLHQVLNSLARAGLVVCRRGRQRGYQLARPPKSIALLEIFEVIEGPLGLTSCTMEGDWCPRSHACTLGGIWKEIQDGMAGTLRRTTLDKLISGRRVEDPGCPISVD